MTLAKCQSIDLLTSRATAVYLDKKIVDKLRATGRNLMMQFYVMVHISLSSMI